METSPASLASNPGLNHEMGPPSRLLCEADAMAEVALSRGKDVPANVITMIDAACQVRRAGKEIPPELLTALAEANPNPDEVKRQLDELLKQVLPPAAPNGK